MKINSAKLEVSDAHKVLAKEIVTIDFNESCNLSCLNCPRSCRLYGSSNDNYWSLADAKKLIDYIVDKLKPKRLDIGVLAEFTIYKYAAEILEYIVTKYPEQNVLITTNFNYVSDRLFKVIEQVSNNNVTINVSLWSVDTDMYKRLQGGNLDNVKKNIKRLLDLKSKVNVMIATIDYNNKQIEEMQLYAQNLANDYNMEYEELIGSRKVIKDKLVLYRNVYMPDYNNIPEDYEFLQPKETLINTSEDINYRQCDVIKYNTFLTYNRCYPCMSTWEYFLFTIDNLDDLSYKLYKQISKANQMEACKNCSAGYTCLGKKVTKRLHAIS